MFSNFWPIVHLYIIHHIHIHIESVELPALFCHDFAFMIVIKQIKSKEASMRVGA